VCGGVCVVVCVWWCVCGGVCVVVVCVVVVFVVFVWWCLWCGVCSVCGVVSPVSCVESLVMLLLCSILMFGFFVFTQMGWQRSRQPRGRLCSVCVQIVQRPTTSQCHRHPTVEDGEHPLDGASSDQ
jgi:hypothetical protein